MVQVFLGLGSNIDRERNVRSAVLLLQRAFPGARFSSVYESEAKGFSGAPFFNLVAMLETDWSVARLMQWIRDVEKQHGREGSEKKASDRTLDIDLLCYGSERGVIDGVQLPREEIRHNAFVLVPMAELAPEVEHPQTGQTFACMASEPAIQRQKLHKTTSFDTP